MADKVKYVLNPKAAREIMQSTQMLQVVNELAVKGETYAKAIAPRDSGEYVNSFRTDARVIGDRVQALIINTAPHAVVVEVFNHGTGDRVMARTAEHLRGQ